MSNPMIQLVILGVIALFVLLRLRSVLGTRSGFEPTNVPKPTFQKEKKDLDEKEREVLKTFNWVFINPRILKEEGEEWVFNEGCLSIPDVRQDVYRQPKVTLEYQDEDFKTHTEVLEGLAARVFQHEFDHIEGVLFTDKLSTLKKRLIKKKLENISKGKINADYRMRFPNLKKGK